MTHTDDLAELRRLRRAYGALSACHAAIVRAHDEPALLSVLCSTLVDTGGYRLAWIGFPEHDDQHTVRPVASAGASDAYLASIHVSWDDEVDGQGPTGVAIRLGRTSVNQDGRTNPLFGPWREAALAHGFASSIAVPLLADGRILGALNVYSADAHAFDDEERALLEQLGESLAHGLAALRTRRQLAVRDQQLRLSAKTEALGQLATGLIHDLNNLLLVIDACAAELGRGLGSPPGPTEPSPQAVAQELQGAVASAVALTRQVLSFGRRNPAEVRRMPIGYVLHQSTPLLRRSVGKHVELSVEIAPDVATPLVVPSEIEEALVNLVLNARDAMEHGGRVTVGLKNAADVPASASPARPPGGAWIELSVADTGAGMTDQVLGRLFEPFFTTKPAGRGTGLGLTMVRTVVEHHDGRLSVESTLGQGTTFRLFFPAGPGR